MAARLPTLSRLARTVRNISSTKSYFYNSKFSKHVHTSCPLLVDGIQVKMPSLSPTMMEGSIVEWHKKEGDTVAAGDILCEIQTDKAVVGFEIDEDGVLAKILVPGNSGIIKIGTLIAMLVEEGQDWQSVEIPRATGGSQDDAGATTSPDPDPAPGDAGSVSQMHGAGPAVRTLLDLYGIAPSDIQGSGPHQNIIKGDLLKYIQSKNLQPVVQAPSPVPEPAAPPPSAPAQPTVSPPVSTVTKAPVKTSLPRPTAPEGADYVDLDLTTMRKVIAKRLTESKMSTPHAYSTIDCNMGNLLKLRKSLLDEGIKVSVNDFIIKACAVSLQRVPEVNALWSEDGAQLSSAIDISVAVATESGLITPIVKDAISLGVEEISNTIKELATRARDGKLKPEEFLGGTFTISNLGMFGVSEFTAVINPPQACIMAIGSSRLELGLDEAIQTMMKVTISADARMVDEFLATRFLEAFQETIENPMLMLSQSPRIDLTRLFAN